MKEKSSFADGNNVNLRMKTSIDIAKVKKLVE